MYKGLAVRFILIALFVVSGLFATAGGPVVCDSVKIYFHQGKDNLDPALRENAKVLDDIVRMLTVRSNDSIHALRRVVVKGAASPEGGIEYNKALSQRRANTIFDYISRYSHLPDSLMEFSFLGRDWEGLARLAQADPNVPYHDETVRLINRLAVDARTGKGGDGVGRLRIFYGGEPWRYMYARLFPELRASGMTLWYEYVPAPIDLPVGELTILVESVPLPASISFPEIGPTAQAAKPGRPFYMDLRTNMLYDAALIPNIGAEFYVGHGFSIGGNWQYAWWSNRSKNRFWRIYGGDLFIRRWFGGKAKYKPLTGHHIGLYAQAITYDVEFGGRGYMAGEPGGNIFDRANLGGGIEYGYSLPVGHRLNIDFTLGLGYSGGTYYEYLPDDGHYVWQVTKKRNWWGPTKAEISLVWLIGRDNFNRKKGGDR